MRFTIMESVKFNIGKHGRIASVQLLPECVIGMTHSDGFHYALAIPNLCEHGELVAVTLIERGGQGIVLTFDDRHDQTIFFADVGARRNTAPSIVPPEVSEDRVRELAL